MSDGDDASNDPQDSLEGWRQAADERTRRAHLSITDKRQPEDAELSRED